MFQVFLQRLNEVEAKVRIRARLKYLTINSKNRDTMNKGLLAKIKIGFLAVLISIFSVAILPAVSAQTSGSSAITSSLCSIISIVASVIAFFAVFMFIIGGVLYAFAHFLPAAGNLKGSMQGWGIGMLMGGIIMLILYILAPYIVGQIVSLGNGGTTAGTTLGNSGSGVPAISPINCAV